MQGLREIAYAQARIQARFGERADTGDWLRLHNIRDLGSYLQTAQQTPLRQWVLGLSTSHGSHDIELALRQKYRHHVDEVAGWMPVDWYRAIHWIRCLGDLPALQHLAAGAAPLAWMRADPGLSAFTADDHAIRLQAMNQAGYRPLVEAWQQGDPMLTGWFAGWNSYRPRSLVTDAGLQRMEKLIVEQVRLQTAEQGAITFAGYDGLYGALRRIFRRHAFQPAAVCAYLAIVAIDLQRVRADLVQRLFLRDGGAPAGEPAT